MREPHGGALGFRREQAEGGRLGGLCLGVVPAGRVQKGQGGARARAGHQQGAADLGRDHVQAAEHQGPQRGGHVQRLARPGRGGILGECAAEFEGEERVAAAGAVDVPDRGAGQAGVAAVVEERGHLGAGERVEADGETVRWQRA